MLCKTVFLFCFLLFAIGSYSQVLLSKSPAYMRTLNVNDGLPQGQVRAMVQDKQGFIWIASEGLSRYDGRTFLNFFNVLGDTTSLADNDILKLQIDDQDNLWIMYQSGEIDIKNTITGHVRHISKEPAFRWLTATAPQTNYLIRQAGESYFAVSWNTLIAFDPITGKHHHVLLPTGEDLLALGGNIKDKALLATPKALYEIKANQLRRVISFPILSNTIYKHWDSLFIVSSQVGITGRPPGQIMAYRNGNLVITAVNGVFIVDRQEKHSSYFADTTAKWRVPSSLVLATDSNIYFPFSTGIYRLSGTQPPEFVFTNGGQEQYYSVLFADRSGMLWAGADVLGIHLFNLQPENFHSYSQKNRFTADALQPWLSTPPPGYYYGSYELRSAKDTGGRIWVLNKTYATTPYYEKRPGPFIFMLDSAQNTKQHFRDSIEPQQFTFDDLNQCWLVYSDKRLGKWILAKLNLHSGAILPFAELARGSKENGYLTAINDKICYFTDDEIRLYDRLTGACTIYTNKQLGISGYLLMALPGRQEKNILWIATKGSGIVKLNIATGATAHFTMANGLPNNTVYFIAPDKRGQFWCSSNKGLFQFNPVNGSVTSFTVKDGLQGNEFNRYHFLETPDGHFIFGGTEGYTVFHPDSIRLDHFQPPVAITDILVNNIPLQQAVARLKDSITTSLDELTLPYNQNFLKFSFAALEYNAPEKLQYRYQLQGIDKAWVNAGLDAFASYAYIPPGHYTFKVNASNTAGTWSNHIKTLEIIIHPPWWKTWWAYTLYVLIIAAIGYALYRNWLQRQQDKQQVILKQKEAAQAHAMEETKSRFFANITHELCTPLTLIMSPVQKQLQEGETTGSPTLLKNVYHNSQLLLRQINQLLDMSKLESGSLPVTLSKGDIILFIQVLVTGFKNAALAKKIDLTYNPAPLPEEYLFDSDKLEKIMYNLLGNALKFTPEGGKIQVVSRQQPAEGSEMTAQHDNLALKERQYPSVGQHPANGQRPMNFQILVSDTGIGIGPEHLPHIFDRFYQVNSSTTRRYEGTGIGLSLVKELTELMGGEIKAESTVGKGSMFTIILPLAIANQYSDAPLVNYPVVPEPIPLATDAATKATSVEDGKKPLVLVTDDNEQLRLFIAESLAPHYQVITAINGEAALQTATTELPELIISDVMMPVMDGYEFCSKVKANPLTAHIGFVMLTAKRADESRMGGLRLGADHYLGKPFIVEELLLVISNLLKRQQKLREYYSRQLGPGEKLPPVKEVEDEFLRSVYTIIESNLDSEKLDVEYLATELSVTRRTLNRKLSTIADTSANELIRNYRLKKAAELLLQGENVSGAAYATGFTTPSYFTQCFKEMYGSTPVQYAENGGISFN